MDHHSFLFQIVLFLVFYGTLEWIRHEQSNTSVTQRQQEQTSDLTHTVGVVDETIGQTDDSIVTSSIPTDIQVHLEPEPAFHTPELVSVVQQTEESVAVAELEANTELNAIAELDPVEPERAAIPISVPIITTNSVVLSSTLESSPEALIPITTDSIEPTLFVLSRDDAPPAQPTPLSKASSRKKRQPKKTRIPAAA